MSWSSNSWPTVMPSGATCFRQFAQNGIEINHGPAIGSPRLRDSAVRCGIRCSKA